MAVLSNSQAQESTIAGLEQTMQLGATVAADALAKYRHTILFAITTLLVIAIAATIAATQVNSIIASLAEEQLINLAEENATRDARHIQSMIIAGGGMAGMAGMGQDSASMDQDLPTGPGSNNSMSMDFGGSTAMAPNNAAPVEKRRLPWICWSAPRDCRLNILSWWKDWEWWKPPCSLLPTRLCGAQTSRHRITVTPPLTK